MSGLSQSGGPGFESQGGKLTGSAPAVSWARTMKPCRVVVGGEGGKGHLIGQCKWPAPAGVLRPARVLGLGSAGGTVTAWPEPVSSSVK